MLNLEVTFQLYWPKKKKINEINKTKNTVTLLKKRSIVARNLVERTLFIKP